MSNSSNEQRAGIYPYCPHGARLGSVLLPEGAWNGPVSRCSCCFSMFGYIDSGSLGPKGFEGTSWQPKDRCGSCGGTYVTHTARSEALPALDVSK